MFCLWLVLSGVQLILIIAVLAYLMDRDKVWQKRWESYMSEWHKSQKRVKDDAGTDKVEFSE